MKVCRIWIWKKIFFLIIFTISFFLLYNNPRIYRHRLCRDNIFIKITQLDRSVARTFYDRNTNYFLSSLFQIASELLERLCGLFKNLHTCITPGSDKSRQSTTLPVPGRKKFFRSIVLTRWVHWFLTRNTYVKGNGSNKLTLVE